MHIPPKVDGVRWYEDWQYNSAGGPALCKFSEDPRWCVESVDWIVRGMSGRRQCKAPRGHGPGGLFCRQHAKMAEKEGWSPDDTP
jgi:hypothetical protein